MFILYEEIQFINSRKVNSPSIPQFPFTTSMSHDHNYKVQEDLTISTWGNSCLLLGNIARILQINQSCFALCIVMSSHVSHRFVIFVLFFLYFGSTGIPSDIKLCLTVRSTTWNDFSSRTTITSAENPDFEIWLELNSLMNFLLLILRTIGRIPCITSYCHTGRIGMMQRSIQAFKLLF